MPIGQPQQLPPPPPLPPPFTCCCTLRLQRVSVVLLLTDCAVLETVLHKSFLLLLGEGLLLRTRGNPNHLSDDYLPPSRV